MADRTVKVILKADVSSLVNGLKQSDKATRDFAKNSTKSAGDHSKEWNQLGTGMMVTGAALAVGVGLAVKAFADFDKEMSNVRAVSGATAGEMDKLRKAALQAGADTKFSASEAAKAEAELAKAGVSTADILGGALTGALSLAAAGGLDLAEAATVSAQAMNIFGLKGKDVTHIADVLASGANKSAADVGSLGDALKQGGLVAAQTGLHLEDTVGVLSMFADSALVGSDAGTSLKTMLMALNPTSEKASAAMESIGFSAYDAQGAFVGMESVAGQLKAGLGGLSEEQRAATLTTIFGSDATRAASILYKSGAEGVREYTKAVNDDGAAARVAAIQMANLSGDLEQLKGSLETALIQAGSGANDALRTMTQMATGAVNAFGDLPAPLQQGALGLGAIGAAGLLAAGGFMTVMPKIAETKKAIEALGLASKLTRASMLSFATGPIGIALAGITVAVGLFAKSQMDAKAKSDDLRASLDQETGAITAATRALVAKTLQEEGSLKLGRELGLSGKQVTDLAMGQAGALELVQVKQSAANAAFKAGIGPTTDLDSATVTGLRDKATGFVTLLNTVAPIRGVLVGQTAAQKELADAVGKTAGSAKVLTQAEQDLKVSAEDNKKAHDALIASITSYGSAMLSARGDARSYEAAIDAATAAVKANGRTLDIGTEKGRNNQAALDAIATSALKVAASKLEAAKANNTLSKATRGVTADVGKARTQFVDMAVKMGMSRAAAERLATQSGLTAGRVKGITTEMIALGKQKPKPKADVEITPAQKKIRTMQGEIDRIKQGKVPGMQVGTAAAKERIADLQRQIANLKGKTIVVSAAVRANFNQAAAHNLGSRASRATGGPIYGPGSGTSDDVPLWGSNGEHMLTADDVKAAGGHAGVFAYRKSLHLAAGGPVGINVDLPSLDKIRAALTVKIPEYSGGMAGSGVQRWLPLVLTALAMTGQSSSMAQTLLRRMNQESGGNPNAINLWDSNARAGYPSRGLMQTIPGTFNAYRMPGLSTSIVDPLSNIVASIRYALATYGSLPAAYNRAGGYAQGTDNASPGWRMVGEEGAELVKFNGGEKVVPNHKLEANAMRFSVGTSAGSTSSAQPDMVGVRSDLMQQTQVLTEQTQILRALVPGFAGALDQQALTFQRMDRTKVGAR